MEPAPGVTPPLGGCPRLRWPDRRVRRRVLAGHIRFKTTADRRRGRPPSLRDQREWLRLVPFSLVCLDCLVRLDRARGEVSGFAHVDARGLKRESETIELLSRNRRRLGEIVSLRAMDRDAPRANQNPLDSGKRRAL